MKIQVKIAGIDVTNYVLRFIHKETNGNEITTLDINLSSDVENIISLEVGQSIEVWYNPTGTTITDPDDKLFKGSIDEINRKKGRISVFCIDELGKTIKKIINRVFLDSESHQGKISEIFKLLLDEAGLSYTSSTIQDTGEANKISKFVCKNTTIFDRLRKLADAVEWQFYYNPVDGYVYFEPPGNKNSGITLEIGKDTGRVVWKKDMANMFNILNVIGGRQLVETTETFTGDGTTKEFILSEVPESIKVYVDGILKRGGVENVSSNPDYTVGKSEKKIIFASAPSSGSNIEVRYSYTIPIPVRMREETSIATYGEIEKVITLSDVEDLEDAIKRGNEILKIRAYPNIYTNDLIVKNDKMLKRGESVSVIDNKHNNSGSYVVVKRVVEFPKGYYKIDLGNLDWQLAQLQEEMLDRIKRLEELQFQNEDVVNNLIQVGEKDTQIERYSIELKTEPIADSFVLGHSENSKLGMGKVLEDFDVEYVSKPYWIERDENGDVNSKVWIKTSLSSSTNKEVYVYYGGSSNKSNGYNVFDVFATSLNDFDNNNGNWYEVGIPSNAGWGSNRNGSTVLKQEQSATGFNGIYKNVNLDYDFIIEGDISRGCGTGGMINIVFDNNIEQGVGCEEYWGHRYREYVNKARSGNTQSLSVGNYLERYNARMKVVKNGNDINLEEYVEYYDGNESATFTRTITNVNSVVKVGFARYMDTCTKYLYFDNLRVRKYDSTATITISYGTEETGSWTIDGETYTKRKKVVISSNTDLTDYQVDLDYSQFNDDKIAVVETTTNSTNKIQGEGSKGYTFSSAGTYNINVSKSFGDLSSYVGVSSGIPTQGTIGLWIYLPSGGEVSNVKLRIGTNSSNYIEQTGVVYANEYNYSLSDSGWIYVIFDLDTATQTGIVNWTSISYCEIEITTTTAGSINLDYLTISKSNEIGLNGLGERYMAQKTQYSKTY